MDILKQNMEALKKRDHDLYNELENKFNTLKVKTDESIEICKTCNNRLNLKEIKQDKTWYIHSNYNAIIEAQRWVSSINYKARMIVVLGFGAGYHIEELIKNIDQYTHIFIIEPNTIIAKLLFEQRDISIMLQDNRISLIISDDEKEIASKIFTLFSSNIMDNVEFAIFNNYSIRYKRLFYNIQEQLRKIINILLVNTSTQQHFKYLWLFNSFKNNLLIHDSANFRTLIDRFKDIPAIIVSAGPSLNKNICLLRELKNKAVIIAGGSAISILNKNNIESHFSVAIDGHPLEKDIFNDLNFKDNSLIYINKLYYEIVRDFSGNKFVVPDDSDSISSFFNEQLNLDLIQIPSSQTVAGINISIASFLGCNPIIFVGQDLAYTNLEMHAQGAAHMKNFKEEKENQPDKFIKVKDIYGNDTYTIKQFLTTKTGMETLIAEQVGKGRKFINATEGGIGLELCQNMTLNEVLEKFLVKNHDNLYDMINKSYIDGKIEATKEQIEELLEKIQEDIKELKDISLRRYNLCKEAKEILEDSDRDYKDFIEVGEMINNIESDIDNNFIYNNLVKLAINQILVIHKSVMNKRLKDATSKHEENLIKIRSIMNQSLEIIGTCNFINNIDKISL